MANQINEFIVANLTNFCYAAAEYAEREGYYIGADHMLSLMIAATEAAEYEAAYCEKHGYAPFANVEAMFAKGRDWARHEVLPSLVDEE